MKGIERVHRKVIYGRQLRRVLDDLDRLLTRAVCGGFWAAMERGPWFAQYYDIKEFHEAQVLEDVTARPEKSS